MQPNQVLVIQMYGKREKAKMVLLGAIYLLFSIANLGLGLWLPQFLKGSGHGLTNWHVSLITMLPYLGAITGLLVWGRHSDKTNERRWHISIGAILAGLGLLIAAFASSLPIAIVAIVLTTISLGGTQSTL